MGEAGVEGRAGTRAGPEAGAGTGAAGVLGVVGGPGTGGAEVASGALGACGHVVLGRGVAVTVYVAPSGGGPGTSAGAGVWVEVGAWEVSGAGVFGARVSCAEVLGEAVTSPGASVAVDGVAVADD